MQPTSSLYERSLASLTALNAEQAWRLTPAQCATRAAALAALLPADCDERYIRAALTHYHHDHELVTALCDHRHPDHDQAWHDWMPRAAMFLHRAGLTWSYDRAIDAEDLMQVARLALLQALPRFRYASSFSTWAYQVTVRSVRRHLRDQLAQKRAMQPVSLDAEPGEAAIGAAEFPANEATARVLVEQILGLLSANAGRRQARIFWLWAVADLRVEEIAQQVGLSVPRVRALLGQARAYLRQHPAICEWDGAQACAPDESLRSIAPPGQGVAAAVLVTAL